MIAHLVTSALLAASPMLAPSSPAPVAYSLVNVHSGKCLTPLGGSDSVVQTACGRTPSYRWLVRPVSDEGGFQLRNLLTRRCLTTAGDLVVQGGCDSGPADRWRTVDTAGTGGHLQNVQSGKCLAVAGAEVGENGAAVQHRCDDDPSHRWQPRVF